LIYFQDYVRPMSWAARLENKFNETGWSKAELARRADIPYDSVNKYLAGKVDKPRGDTLAALARALDVPALWLEKGIDQESPTRLVPLKGYIGAGGHIEALEQGPDEVDAPADSHPDTVAAEIKGDSQLPVLQDGWIIYWSTQLPASSMINKLAIIQLSDGRIMVKTLRNGSAPGLWTLTSYNAADIVDVPVDWVAKIDWIKPR
jgi:transcriptional regulator with XRE-family HTH domain